MSLLLVAFFAENILTYVYLLSGKLTKDIALLKFYKNGFAYSWKS